MKLIFWTLLTFLAISAANLLLNISNNPQNAEAGCQSPPAESFPRSTNQMGREPQHIDAYLPVIYNLPVKLMVNSVSVAMF